MSNWDYTREESNRLSAGDYRVEIVDAEEKTSKSGNKMIVVTVQPNGNIKIQTSSKTSISTVTQLFDSFNIEEFQSSHGKARSVPPGSKRTKTVISK